MASAPMCKPTLVQLESSSLLESIVILIVNILYSTPSRRT